MEGVLRLKSNNITYNLEWGHGGKYSNFVEVKTGNEVFLFPNFYSKKQDTNSFYYKNGKLFQVGNHDQFNLMYRKFFNEKKGPSIHIAIEKYIFIKNLLV